MKRTFWVVLAVAVLLGGCANDSKPSMFGNPDKNLDKTSAEFAADAAKRSYEFTAAKGGAAAARASFELMSRRFDLVNLSDQDWPGVEVWLNQKYVVFIPMMQKSVDKRLEFEMFFDQEGHHFSTDNGKNPIKTLELFHDGKMYTVATTQE